MLLKRVMILVMIMLILKKLNVSFVMNWYCIKILTDIRERLNIKRIIG